MTFRRRRTVAFAAALALALPPACDASMEGGDASPACRPAHACAPMDALVVMSDQASSGVGALALDAGAGAGAASASAFFGVDLGRDPSLSLSNGRAFMIARDLDTIFELSPGCGEPLCRWSTRLAGREASTNPQDVAAAPDGSLWIPRFALPSVAILDDRGREAHTLELPDLDGDGNPNASAIRIAQVAGVPKAFIALGLLEYEDAAHPFRSIRPSVLLVADVASRTIERTIELRARNPFNTIVEHGGRFFLTGAGNFDVADEPDAGVERLDPAAPDVARMLVSEPELGGSASAVAVDDGCAAAIVADASVANATSVVTFDPESGETLRTAQKGGPLFGPSSGFDLWAIAWSEGRLLVGDRRRSDRGYPIHVFERQTPGGCDLVERAEPIYVAQKPVALRSIR
jgi:hypothetical protein